MLNNIPQSFKKDLYLAARDFAYKEGQKQGLGPEVVGSFDEFIQHRIDTGNTPTSHLDFMSEAWAAIYDWDC